MGSRDETLSSGILILLDVWNKVGPTHFISHINCCVRMVERDSHSAGGLYYLKENANPASLPMEKPAKTTWERENVGVF